jgi:anti-anti-sigma factor
VAQTTFSWDHVTTVGWRLVHATGDLDLATAPELDRVLRAAIAADTERHLVLDLGAVTFLDCCGLSSLVRAQSTLLDRFWLTNVPPPVARLLDLAGLTDVFCVLDAVPGLALAPAHS